MRGLVGIVLIVWLALLASQPALADHPIPAWIVAVTLPPALDIAFMVSLIAATGDEVIE